MALHVPKLRFGKFETAIIERYKRREASMEVTAHNILKYGRSSVKNIDKVSSIHLLSREGLSAFHQLNQRIDLH